MDTLDIEKFDPTIADLQSLVSLTSQVVVTDINDKGQIEAVKTNRILLRDARVAITKKGKEMRESALKFQKDVITRERELIAVIEPEEERLRLIEDEVKAKKLRAERFALLPERTKKLVDIGDGKDYSDKTELLLGMDNDEFQAYLNTQMAQRNESVRLENERKAREISDKEDELKREAETREREEKARQEEREKAEQRERERLEREANTKLESEKKAIRDKEEADRLEADRKEKLARDAKYQAFLTENNYDGTDAFHIIKVGTEMRLYKQIGTFNVGEDVAE